MSDINARSTWYAARRVFEGCSRAIWKATYSNYAVAARSKVTEGYLLADSLFDFLISSMSCLWRHGRCRGKSGHLDAVLERLADYAENRQKMRSVAASDDLPNRVGGVCDDSLLLASPL